MFINDLCFEITEQCTNNCLFCSSCSSIDKNKMISFCDFKRVIDYFILRGGISEISLSGGEPLLHPSLIDMVKYCSSKNIKTTIYTSGILLNKKIDLNELNYIDSEKFIIERLNRQTFAPIDKAYLYNLKMAGLNKIVFDLQSIDVDNYNYLMGTKGNIANVLASIIYANSVSIYTEIHFVPMKPNYSNITDILEIAEMGEVKRVSVLRFVAQGRGKENSKFLQLSEKELDCFLKTLEVQQIYHGEIRVGTPLIKNNEHLCTAGKDKLSIRYDGAILPCPAFKDLPYGQVKNIYDNLEEIELGVNRAHAPLCKKRT